MSTLDRARSVGLPYQAEAAPALSLSELEEFHDRHANDTFWARTALLAVIFAMLGVNLWMTQRSYDAMMADVDASRMAMSAIHEQTVLRLEAVEARLAAMEARLPAEPTVASAR